MKRLLAKVTLRISKHTKYFVKTEEFSFVELKRFNEFDSVKNLLTNIQIRLK